VRDPAEPVRQEDLTIGGLGSDPVRQLDEGPEIVHVHSGSVDIRPSARSACSASVGAARKVTTLPNTTLDRRQMIAPDRGFRLPARGTNGCYVGVNPYRRPR